MPVSFRSRSSKQWAKLAGILFFWIFRILLWTEAPDHILGYSGFGLLRENYKVGTWLQCPHIRLVRCCPHLCAWHCGFPGCHNPPGPLSWVRVSVFFPQSWKSWQKDLWALSLIWSQEVPSGVFCSLETCISGAKSLLTKNVYESQHYRKMFFFFSCFSKKDL